MYLLNPRIFILLILGVPAFGQSINSTLTKFENYHRQTPHEKVYIHTDKEVYSQNETLWFNVYLLDATAHIPGTPSSLVYINLFDDKSQLITELTIKIANGTGEGEVFLSDSLAQGTYTLMAYTNYMRNFDKSYFFSKPIKLLKYSSESLNDDPISTNTDIDFQIFPEGGELINGMPNIVAFRATNELGSGIELKVEIVDENKKVIEETTTHHLGMGLFQLTPADSKKYFANYQYNGQAYSTPLQSAKSSGYQLSVRQDISKTYITVKSTPDLSFDDCFVIAHIRGRVVSAFKAVPGKKFIYSVIENNQVPSGIIHLTFFRAGQPLLERLAFINNVDNQTKISALLSNKVLGKREEANFELSILGEDSLSQQATTSVTVLASSYIANKLNIENYLLINSDLRGTIERIEYYTDLTTSKKIESLNLLMLTHGWRRFDWNKLLLDSLPQISYYPENGFTIEGQVVKYYNRNKGQKTTLALSFMGDLSFNMGAETLDDGTFWFDGLQISDTTTALVRTIKDPEKNKKKSRKGKTEEKRDMGTYVDIKSKDVPEPLHNSLEPYKPKESYRLQLDQQLQIEQIMAEFDEKIIVLEGVEVAASRDRSTEPYYRNPSTMPYRNPDTRIILDSIDDGPGVYYSIFNLVSRAIPILQVVINEEGTKEFNYRREPVIVYLDGIELINPLQIAAINPESVEFMDLLRGFTPINTGFTRTPENPGDLPTLQRSLFIYTRATAKKSDPFGLQLINMYGYHQPAEFYVPKYDIMTTKEKLKPDYRTTQYWNPNVKITNGKANLSYFTSDNIGNFIMYIEGISSNGKIIRQEFKFSVN